MSAWLAWARSTAIAWGALTVFAAAATQLLAAIFGYDEQFGAPIAWWYGHPLYDPWRFLHWGVELTPTRPWIALLSILLALICTLAAFAVLVLAGLMAPANIPKLRSRRRFCWDKLGQRGLLAANGLALGAARRHWLAKPEIISAPAGNVALVGAPEHTDASLIAAISAWRGALVLIEARGLALRLPRQNLIRFAPGRADSASYNPMLAIRGGAHAWVDALVLVRSFLQSGDDALNEVFAALVLDQLLTASPEQRNLAAIRRRLSEPRRVLVEICVAWPQQFCSAPTPHCEIARAVRMWRAAPNATLDRLSAIDAALALFTNGAYALVTQAHQFRFADLVAGDNAGGCVISLPAGDAAHAAPLISILLAQLAMECAAQPDLDRLGRPKQRELLVVVEARALQALAGEHPSSLLLAHGARNGCYLLAQATTMQGATHEVFDTIAAIGPQTEAASACLSKLGGAVVCWRSVQTQKPTWRNWAFPDWERVERPIVAPGDLHGADPSTAFLFLKGMGPILARAVCADDAQTSFADGAELDHVAHDWSAAALSRADVAPHEAATPTSAAPIGTKIRSALTRRAPPRFQSKAVSP